MIDPEPPEYVTMEFQMDTQFSMACVGRIFGNVCFILLNALLVFFAIDDANPALFLFVLYMLGDILVCILCCILLVRVSQRGGVARMFTTLPSAHKLPILQHYAFASHSPALPMWYAVTALQCGFGAICWLVASLIAVSTNGGDYLIVALLVGAKLFELLVRYQQLRSFYASVVLGSVKSVLATDAKRKRYAESRAIAIRNRLLLVNPEVVKERARRPKKEKQPDPVVHTQRQKDI
jgi:hypothetical protein